MSMDNPREIIEIGGFKITRNQEMILRGFAGTYHSDHGRTEWTITERGGVSWGWDNTRSSTEPVFRALAKKGVFTITEEEFTPRGWNADNKMKREVFTLAPSVVEHYAAIRKGSAKQAADRERARQAEQDARHAKETAEKRDQAARAMAVNALIAQQPQLFEHLLEAAYKSLDTTAQAVAAADSISSIQEA